MKMKEKNSDFLKSAVPLVLSMLSAYAVLWALTADKPFAASTYNSYLLQALRWLSGHLDLGQNYSYLEIAEYGGKYFISFPPIPSVILLPFAAIFGLHTPDHLIAVIIGIIGGLYALRMALAFGLSKNASIFGALLLTIGSNFLHIGYRADVWYFAQVSAFTFTIMALYYARFGKEKNGWLPLFLLALAVGCRPLNMVYLPLIGYLLWKNYGKTLLSKTRLWWFLPPLAVGIFLMALNFLRFGNVFEFGHNYLPEFAEESPNGQFWLGYLPYNLERMFRLPTLENGWLNFPIFDGVALWLVSPVFLVWAYRLIKDGYKDWKSPGFWLTVLLPILHLFFLCCHKTLGGWQFGNRYTVDLLPVIFYGVLIWNQKQEFSGLCLPLLFWGLGINLVGTVALMNGWL